MTKVAERMFMIDASLRLAFVGLECALGVSLRPLECERVFSDAEHDRVAAKQYLFLSSGDVLVSGAVDDYEPETIRVQMSGARDFSGVLSFVDDAAEAAWTRMKRSGEARQQRMS